MDGLSDLYNIGVAFGEAAAIEELGLRDLHYFGLELQLQPKLRVELHAAASPHQRPKFGLLVLDVQPTLLEHHRAVAAAHADIP